MKTAAAVIAILFVSFIWISVAFKSITFKQNCGGYLKRAADANTIEMAQGELKIVLDYLENHNLTSGYTSILWQTPDEDISFWYNNIKTSYNELQSLSDSATALEKSNMLIKLRETLMDSGEKGSHTTIPDGISRFPSNGLWAVLNILALIAIVGIIILFIEE